ncbi:MAG: NFACT family protein [Clostridia bacterium]|nr:NFACT family protein [Clostridia bacterium]
MPLDGYTLSFIIKELNRVCIGSKIDKIYQPSKEEFIFNLRSKSASKKLYISASSAFPRINFTEKAPENPSAPPMLCMFMRKHLTGSFIESINQFGLDRILSVDLTGTNEIGDKVNYRLIVELVVKHANLIILNSDGIILEASKKSDYSEATGRNILPGFKYMPPPGQNKLDILQTSNEEIIRRIKKSNNDVPGALLGTLEGMSPLISKEIASRSGIGSVTTGELTDVQTAKLDTNLTDLRNLLLKNGEPVLFENNGKKDFSFTEITQFGFSCENTKKESFSQLLEEYYNEKSSSERSNQQGRELNKHLNIQLVRAQRKLEIRKEELEKCKDKDQNRIYAELILANQYSLNKGSFYYDLENFYDNYSSVRIKVNPALSPSENAQKYFKEYNKLKNAEKLLDELIDECQAEITYLKSVIDNVNRAEGYSDIEEIKNELYEEGYLKNKKNKKDRKTALKPPIKYRSDDGYLILAGRNNRQNEILSFKTAAKNDSWFHVQSFPGSHIIVIGNGDILPERTCRQAAIIAAYNSPASTSSQVAVDYTETRELKKPNGGKPGMVIYHTYNTMWVTPDRELCERLRIKDNN